MIRAIWFWRFTIPVTGVLLASVFLAPTDQDRKGASRVATNAGQSDRANPRDAADTFEDANGATSSVSLSASTEISDAALANANSVPQLLTLLPRTCGWNTDPELAEAVLLKPDNDAERQPVDPGAETILHAGAPSRENERSVFDDRSHASTVELTSYLGQGAPWFDPIAAPLYSPTDAAPSTEWQPNANHNRSQRTELASLLPNLGLGFFERQPSTAMPNQSLRSQGWVSDPRLNQQAHRSQAVIQNQPVHTPQHLSNSRAPVYQASTRNYPREGVTAFGPQGPIRSTANAQQGPFSAGQHTDSLQPQVSNQQYGPISDPSSAQYSATDRQPYANAAETEAARLGNLAVQFASRHSNANTESNRNDTNTGGDDSAEDPHLEIYSRTLYPSALECAGCHEQIYQEWALSNHAYASISPMFHKFEQKINDLASGTVGYFCLRCHAPVATTMGLRRDQAIWDGPRVFREGVTCVACHRVDEQFGKTNGERRMVPGDASEPVYSSGHGAGIAYAIENADHFKVRTDVDPEGPGQTIHRRAIRFEQLSRSDFCISCHQVAVDPQIKLEVVWDQYRASPAFRQGITCQDCHMGRVPGVAEGYSVGPVAVVSERVVNPARKHSNHAFFGPGGSIAHPGIFPHNADADRWTVNQWLQFDWRAGWGTDEFEDQLDEGSIHVAFPEVWSNVDDRYDAREVLDANLETMVYKNELRKQVMSNGSHIDGPYFRTQPSLGRDLNLHYIVTNTNSGHNLPSGSLGAQPQVWLNVALVGPAGNRIWESGYLDSNGDLADLHSLDVLADRVPFDDQLFNLQTKFLTTNVKGTDREMYLPVNIDIDQLPFLRPPAQPVSVINHPPFIRMEAHSLPPLGSRNANYRIPGELLQTPGPYRLSVRLRSRGEPIYFMLFVGATEEMTRAMNESIVDLHEYSVEFVIE